MWHREATLPGSGTTVDVLFLDTEVSAGNTVTHTSIRCKQAEDPINPHPSQHDAATTQQTSNQPPKPTNTTQGFSVANVTEAYDAQVFAAATLLSSLLVYNSMHVLHANELEYLDLLVRWNR